MQALDVAPELLAQAEEMLGNTDVKKSRAVKQALLADAKSGGKAKDSAAGKGAGKSKSGKPSRHRKGAAKPKADGAPSKPRAKS